MIKEIIFDCFGVLTQDGWLTFLEKYGTEDVLEELHYLNHQADRGILSFDEFIERTSKLTGANKDEVYAIIAQNHHPNEKLFAYICELKQSGYDVGIISNVGMELNHFLPEEYIKIFDRATLSYQVGAIKPDPLLFEAHLAKSGFEPAETIFIDDREVNCEGAKAVGMHAIHYQDFQQMKQNINSLIQ